MQRVKVPWEFEAAVQIWTVYTTRFQLTQPDSSGIVVCIILGYANSQVEYQRFPQYIHTINAHQIMRRYRKGVFQ